MLPGPPLWCVCARATYKGEVCSILAEQPGEDSLPLDALLILKHVSVHETVQHGGVGMDINVELQTDSLMEEEEGEKKRKENREGRRQRETHTQKIKKKPSRLAWKMGYILTGRAAHGGFRGVGLSPPPTEPPDTAD